MKKSMLEALRAARAGKQPVALLTAVDGGAQALVPGDAERAPGGFGAGALEVVREALRADRSGMREIDGARVFVHVFNPPLRMLIVGAVHIAQFLAPLATLVGYEVTIVDPRRSFASTARFPGVQLVDDWPDDALARLAPDTRTALVTLTHDPKLDDPALQAGLRSPAFYIGSLGSTRTHAARLERLRAEGFGDGELSRIHAPIGLDIGAKSPAEIAASVVAEVTQVLRRGGA